MYPILNGQYLSRYSGSCLQILHLIGWQTEDVPPAGMQGVKFSKRASFLKRGEKDEHMGLLLCCN